LTGPVISNLIRWIQVDLGGFKWVGFATWKVGRMLSGGLLWGSEAIVCRELSQHEARLSDLAQLEMVQLPVYCRER
jgi:hypothetical protein